MRVLSVMRKGYYGSSRAVEPMYLYFTLPLRAMGHEVDTFDHYDLERCQGKAACTDHLVRQIQSGGYDVVFYQTAGSEPVETAGLAHLATTYCLVAWNSDDDWQWETTRRLYPHFSYMVTTYPHVHEQNRETYPNLLLSQWACLELPGDFARSKDIPFSFAGAVYGVRNEACRYLRRKAGLLCFGRGARLVNLGLPYFRGVLRLPWLSGGAIDFKEINEVWKRSWISYTPMAGGPTGQVLSIKSRTFDMGLSGTLMLAEHSPNLELYYEPGREFVAFTGLDDCAKKARWYLAHETERARIAAAYRERTLKEHLWQRRFADLFVQIGLK